MFILSHFAGPESRGQYKECLELGKKLAAARGEAVHSLAAGHLLAGTYVDDHCGGGSREEVDMMRGRPRNDGGFSGTMQKILEPCGFKANFMVKSVDYSNEEVSLTIQGRTKYSSR